MTEHPLYFCNSTGLVASGETLAGRTREKQGDHELVVIAEQPFHFCWHSEEEQQKLTVIRKQDLQRNS